MIFEIVYFTCLVTAYLWGSYCIQRSSQERIETIQSRMTRCITGPKLKAACDAVPFGRHVQARLFFRDPWKLYDPMVLDAIQNPVLEFPVMVAGEAPPDAPPAVH